MALLFADSFDHYTTVSDKWTQSTASLSISSGNGRNGTSCGRVTTTNGTAKRTIGSLTTWVFGSAFRANTVSDNNPIMTLSNSGSAVFEIGITPAGKIYASRSGTVIATGTIILSMNVYYFIECKVTLNASTGTITTKINGVTDLNLTGQNTGGTTADTFGIGQRAGGNNNFVNTWDWDDLYVLDTTGSAPTNDFLGDVRVEAIFPNNNGNSSQLVGSDSNSTDNYLLVDESAPNSDTDYVESSTVGDKDTYAMGNLTSTTGTVYGVQILPFAKKTDAGTRSIKSVTRLSTTEEDSADKTLSTVYAYLPDIRETKPGGGAWSISDVNSAEIGVKVSA